MKTFVIRLLASILVGFLTASCGTVRESRRPDVEEVFFLPRAPRALASPVVEEQELRGTLEEILPSVNVEAGRAELRRMVADPRFRGRQPEELRLVLTGWGSGPTALEEISQGYRAWCGQARRPDCFTRRLTDSDVYGIAFDFAMGAQWDGFVRELRSTIEPSTIRLILLTGMVIFMASIAIPELTSKIPAAIATALLTAYLGAQAVCDLIFGWIQMVRELDAATTFDQVREAGQRYGRVIGTQTARILIMLATSAIAEGGLVARMMKLPRVNQASAALAAETGGVGLEAVGAVTGVSVLQGGVAITVEGAATGAVAVAMAARGTPPSSGTTATEKYAVRKYKDMPRPRPAGTEAHHGVLDAWMRKRFPRYRSGEAPAVLVEGGAHDLTRGVFNRWLAMMNKRMGGVFDWGKVSESEVRDLSEQLFDAAEVPAGIRQEFWRQFEQYKASLSE